MLRGLQVSELCLTTTNLAGQMSSVPVVLMDEVSMDAR